MHIRTKEYVKIPENLKEKIYPVINELNLNFRWCTFVINTDNELIVKMDASWIWIPVVRNVKS